MRDRPAGVIVVGSDPQLPRFQPRTFSERVTHSDTAPKFPKYTPSFPPQCRFGEAVFEDEAVVSAVAEEAVPTLEEVGCAPILPPMVDLTPIVFYPRSRWLSIFLWSTSNRAR